MRVGQVVNTTRQTMVASQACKADHYFARLLGLMGRAAIPQDFGLWITPCNQIHSFFMRFEFDAIFLDKNGKVLCLLERMKPWGLSKFVKGAKVTLELPAGTITQCGVQVGDVLTWEDEWAA